MTPIFLIMLFLISALFEALIYIASLPMFWNSELITDSPAARCAFIPFAFVFSNVIPSNVTLTASVTATMLLSPAAKEISPTLAQFAGLYI